MRSSKIWLILQDPSHRHLPNPTTGLFEGLSSWCSSSVLVQLLIPCRLSGFASDHGIDCLLLNKSRFKRWVMSSMLFRRGLC